MEWSEASTDLCPVGMTIDLLGEKWMLLIVRDVVNGVHRFEDLRLHLGVSDAVLADRLRKLVDAEILEKRPYREPGRRPRAEYHVTARGRDLMPVLLAFKQWGEVHLADPARPAIVAHHRGCGGEVAVDLRCDQHGDLTIGPDEVAVVPGPGARRSRTPLPKRP